VRKLIVSAMTSLDGVMQAPGGPQEDPTGGFSHGGWVFPFSDETGGKELDRLFGRPFDLVLGRKTYDIFAAYWPGKDNAIGRAFNRVAKHVATRDRDLRLDWEHSRSLGPDVVASLRKLKSEDGPDLLTQGSTDLLKTLFAHDLVDEIDLRIYPVVLGRGKRLFGDGSAPGAYTLLRSATSPAGVIFNSYARAGAVPTGSFVDEPPTQAELERRRKLV